MSKSRSILNQEVVEQISRIRQADMLVGIPSYNNADTIGHVIETVSEGLARHFPDLKAVIVNSDGSPDDATRRAALEAPVLPGISKIVTAYEGPSGKGSAFHTIFEVADRLGAQTCIVVDSDLRSITPDWIRLLGEPIYQHNYGFVAPLYSRHKFDGTITNALAYPLMRALYGRSIRQPIGGEFALSGSLAKILSHQNVWESDIARFGIDIWITTTAVCEGFAICQAKMGVKLHDEKDPGTDLGPMFRQVVGTIFELMGKYQTKWRIISSYRVAEIFGDYPEKDAEPIDVDLDRLRSRFRENYVRVETLLPNIVSADNWTDLKRLTLNADGEALLFPDRLWARLVYDHAVAYNFSSEVEREDILSSLLALFLGRTAGFISEARSMSDIEVEELVFDAAEAFAMEKRYLVERWGANVAALSR
jgi:hypothetical protein